ncbi:site-specific DNA-methyltransferase [Streptococcus sp. CSL10205-OR2]|uniref:site-specific DNA-methyltransferase n=1 Tax=Streptococcus sp. CSL10205-OR2 TaxID=2980558 RepID=UPI0021DA696A|nr:site-specific DNA-methyltransferase [Streptococcus sp. CSL10205-OR2]MCU9534002.1 site-specific DNA-methyltransferase [Streptococcus sp. CSL10205-OR2]
MIGKKIQDNKDIRPNTRELIKLKENFPQFFNKEGEFELDKFQEFLKEEEIDISKEGYGLEFLGKSYAKYLSSLETETYLAPDIDHNSKEENKNSENLYIVGDNIDALKHLLGSYAGKIKCIYIDPPYNTGSDGFVYPDNFRFSAEEMSRNIGITEGEAQRILNLAGKSTHSAWLTFMYTRLVLARDLLSDDGVIFISIDDNEQANLKLICDEIYGEENFICDFSWRKKTGANDAKDIAVITESILLYSKNKELVINEKIFKRDLNSINMSRYSKKDQYFNERGYFYYDTLDRGGLQYSDSMNFPITLPDGRKLYPNNRKKFENDGWIWKWSKNKVNWGIEHEFIDFIKVNNEFTVKYKVYELVDNEGNPREQRGRAFSNLILDPINQIGTNEIKALFDNVALFNNPKPVNLVKYLINTIFSQDINILDFFSGSATTADAVMQLNAEDGGERKYIMVQLPEKIEKNKPAYEAEYRTIDEIGRARIEKAAAKIKKETKADIDYGYKLYYLEKPEEKTLVELENFEPEIKLITDDMVSIFDNSHASGKESILSTWLSEDGYGLTKETEDYKLDQYLAKLIGKSLYIIEEGLTDEDVMTLIKSIESEELDISRVVIYVHSIQFNVLHELRKNLKVLRNNKNVSLIERF